MRILGSRDVVLSNVVAFQESDRLTAMAAGAGVAEFCREQTIRKIVPRLNLGVVVVVVREYDWRWRSRHGYVLLCFAV